jgi:hypothetical protein
MRLRIADCGFRIACRVIVPLMLLAAMPMTAVAQSQPAHTPLDSATAQTTQPFRLQVPVAFARSGRPAVIEIPLIFNRPVRQVVLRAFGRVWTEPALFNGRFETSVPAVRVPTVFSITPPDTPDFVLGELVAYPEKDVEWDKKIVLLAAGAPRWFAEWSEAVGLPVTWVLDNAKIPADLPAIREDQKALLILGRARAGKRYTQLRSLYDESRCNLLVLDAEWGFGSGGAVSLRPDRFTGLLAGIAQQRWADALHFSRYHFPNRIIANRWRMTNGEFPPIEVFGDLATGPWISWAGLPWYEQLGRREQADATLLIVLQAAAAFHPGKVPPRRAVLIYPERVTYDPKTMGYGPALACLDDKRARVPIASPCVYIIDLRGDKAPDQDLLSRLSKLPSTLGQDDRILLLGDDRMLDEWKWLSLNRAKKNTDRPGVVWLADDQPWNKTYEIHLIQTLTELGVPLGPPEQEEERK